MEGLNISALARRTGVPAHTLRKWEERYGILTPLRTKGGQRRYSERDISRVEWLRDRLAEGYRIGEAAALLGTAAAAAPRSAREAADAIYEALRRGDADSVQALLARSFSLYRLEDALSEIIAPVLERVGEAWATGEMSVADEHLVSAGVRAQVEGLLADPRGAVRGTAVLACAPSERHELGLLVLAALMRADGWNVAYLGADTPIADAVRFAARVSARLLCLSVALVEHSEDLRASVSNVEIPETITLVVGGAAASAELAARIGAVYVGPDLRAGIRQLRELGR